VAIIGSIPQLVTAGVQLFISLIQNLPTIIQEIVKAVPQIIRGLTMAFSDGVSQMWNIGKELIMGLWNGIASLKDWLWDSVKSVFSGVINGVKKFLGINSPSKVFAEIGDSMGEGVGVGFVGAMDEVSRQMQDAIPTSFDTDFDVRGSYKGGGYGGAVSGNNTTVTQNISITSPKALSEKEAAREFYNLSRKLALQI
jgi:hypothetical protein